MAGAGVSIREWVEDGFVSAAQASRRSGIPVSAIINSIQRGWLFAERTSPRGRYWIPFSAFAKWEKSYRFWGGRVLR